MSARVWLVMPTYNERENLERLLAATVPELQSAVPGDWRLLIVDDGSPDGTGEVADRLAAADHRIEVLHRQCKSGLGQAYISGFQRALAGGAELVMEMDADFSHDPRHLPELLAAAEQADVVLGSRYVPGGAVVNWGLLRRLISRGGGSYARLLLGIEVRDLTGGYKCIRRQVLEAIDLPTLRSDGYVFQIEVTYRAVLAGFRVREIPIVFADRSAGASKMSWRIAAEAMWLVPQLRRSNRWRAPAGLPPGPGPTSA